MIHRNFEARYNAVGNLSETLLPNGVRTIYEYGDLNLLQSETLTDASGTLLAYYSYTTLANGYFAGATEQVRQDDGSYATRQVVYAYDSLYRLKKEKGSGSFIDEGKSAGS